MLRWVLGAILFIGGVVMVNVADHDSPGQAVAFWTAVAGFLILFVRDFLPRASLIAQELVGLIQKLVKGVFIAAGSIVGLLLTLVVPLAGLYFLVRFVKWAWTD